MNPLQLQTIHLALTLRSPQEVQAELEQLDPAMRREISADWLQRVTAATVADPWVHGFTMRQLETGTVVGSASFKAPPNDQGVVEIAYYVVDEYQGRGYATEAAAALTNFAFDSGQVERVIAHTLPANNASTRVLTKCGFTCLGEVTDPDDGLVWRWEKRPESV